MLSRRTFVGTAATAAAGLAVASTARSYGQIAGANDRVHFAVIGLNSRAYAHLSSLAANRKDARITHVCDVDSTILDKFSGATTKIMGDAPAADKDFRTVLGSRDVDAITIATPDHWHAPMAILGLQAGNHVYVEKPCSYNPQEGLWLVKAAQKSGGSARWARSSAPRRTRSKWWKRSTPARSARPTTRRPGMRTSANRLATAR